MLSRALGLLAVASSLSCFEDPVPPATSETTDSSSGPSASSDGTPTPSMTGDTESTTTTPPPTTGSTTDVVDSGTTEEPPPAQCEDGVVAPDELCLEEITVLMAGEPITAVRIGDVSGSTAADVVYLLASDQIVVRVGDGDGNFGPAVFDASVSASHIELADFDGDGELDLTTVGPGDMLRLLVGSGSGSFAPSDQAPVGMDGHTLTVGDLDGNGAPDVVVGTVGLGMVFPVLGLGDGELMELPSLPSFGEVQDIVSADFTGDGTLDVAFTISGGATEGVALRPGDGAGGLADQLTTPGGMSGPRDVVTGDFNGDGQPDLAYVSPANGMLGVLLSNGAGEFSEEQTYLTNEGPVVLAAADLTANGRDDIVVGHDADSDLLVMSPGPGGTLGEPVVLSLAAPVGDLHTGDINDDGALDIVAALDGAPVVVVLWSTP